MEEKFYTLDFLDWVHKLTLIGYDQDIIIMSEHSEYVMALYQRGLTPELAFEEYFDFVQKS